MKKNDVLKITGIVYTSGVNPPGHSMGMELINGIYGAYVRVWVWFNKEVDVELADHREFKALTPDDEAWLRSWAAKIAKEREGNASD